MIEENIPTRNLLEDTLGFRKEVKIKVCTAGSKAEFGLETATGLLSYTFKDVGASVLEFLRPKRVFFRAGPERVYLERERYGKTYTGFEIPHLGEVILEKPITRHFGTAMGEGAFLTNCLFLTLLSDHLKTHGVSLDFLLREGEEVYFLTFERYPDPEDRPNIKTYFSLRKKEDRFILRTVREFPPDCLIIGLGMEKRLRG